MCHQMHSTISVCSTVDMLACGLGLTDASADFDSSYLSLDLQDDVSSFLSHGCQKFLWISDCLYFQLLYNTAGLEALLFDELLSSKYNTNEIKASRTAPRHVEHPKDFQTNPYSLRLMIQQNRRCKRLNSCKMINDMC